MTQAQDHPYPSTATLAQFRRRIALTNRRAPWHYMALARSSRGQDPLKDAATYAGKDLDWLTRPAPSTAIADGFAETASYGFMRWNTLQWASERVGGAE